MSRSARIEDESNRRVLIGSGLSGSELGCKEAERRKTIRMQKTEKIRWIEIKGEGCVPGMVIL